MLKCLLSFFNKNKVEIKKDEKVVRIQYKNNSERLILEHHALEDANKPLFDLIQDAAEYVSREFNKDIVITMIGRTQKEQDDIYAGTTSASGREYDKKPWRSPHQFDHAVDLRSRIFSEDEINQLVDYLNAKYNQVNYYKWTAKNHNVGRGDHFHIQLYVQ